MGFFDNLRDRLSGNSDDDYYDDDYYDDYDDTEDDGDDDRGNGVLGNTSRPEAESVSVYTRSGRPVSNNAGGPTGYEGQNLDGAGYAPSYRREDGARPSSSARQGYPSPSGSSTAKARMNASGKLPPYVLHASAYSDVQTVVRRVRTNQPVVLALGEIDPAVATRILDFSYGLAFGINGQVQQIAGRTFAVVPEGLEITDAEIEKLRSDGDVED